MVGLAALAALLVVPPFLPRYWLEVLISILFFAYLGAAWNILGGYAGQFSFGHAAFFGIGAYTSTLLSCAPGSPRGSACWPAAGWPWPSGSSAGYLSFRYGLRGPYFSLVTLAFAEMLRVVAVNWKFVGSSLGLVVPTRVGPALFLFGEKLPYYYVILAMALGALLRDALDRAREARLCAWWPCARTRTRPRRRGWTLSAPSSAPWPCRRS